MSIKDSLEQQIHYNGNIFGNKCCRCNEGSLYIMANSAVPDQLASSEANCSGSTLFANVGYIGVQQNLGLMNF